MTLPDHAQRNRAATLRVAFSSAGSDAPVHAVVIRFVLISRPDAVDAQQSKTATLAVSMTLRRWLHICECTSESQLVGQSESGIQQRGVHTFPTMLRQGKGVSQEGRVFLNEHGCPACGLIIGIKSNEATEFLCAVKVLRGVPPFLRKRCATLLKQIEKDTALVRSALHHRVLWGAHFVWRCSQIAQACCRRKTVAQQTGEILLCLLRKQQFDCLNGCGNVWQNDGDGRHNRMHNSSVVVLAMRTTRITNL